MPTQITFRGTRADLMQRLRQLPGVLAGTIPDTTGTVIGLQQRVGLDLMGKVQDAFVIKSEGGTDAMGKTWAPLSPVTLALRRKEYAPKVLTRLQAELADKMAPHERRLIERNRQELLAMYGAGGERARIKALGLARLMKKYISPTRYKKLLSELNKPMSQAKLEKVAFAGAFAKILRDTGRLLNSLAPDLVGTGDQKLDAGQGFVTIGTNVAYAKWHQFGTRKMPKRQIFPEAGETLPVQWEEDMAEAMLTGLESGNFWASYLS